VTPSSLARYITRIALSSAILGLFPLTTAANAQSVRQLIPAKLPWTATQPQPIGPQLPDTDTLYAIWQVHVDPGPPWNSSQATFLQGCFILNEMAEVFEAHALPMYVAVSWNFNDASQTWDLAGSVPGSIGNLAARGHEIGVHNHLGASLQDQVDGVTALTGIAPVSFDGAGDYDSLVALGIRIGGAGPGKDVSTQLTENGTRAYRPDRDDGFAYDPIGDLLAIQGGSFEGQSYEPDETANMTIALDYDMARMTPGKLHSWIIATHPDESLGRTNAQIVADMAKIDLWLTNEIDPRILDGSLTWTTKRDFLAIYEQWEAAGGDHDDIFPALPGITQPDWSVLTTSNSGLVSEKIASIDSTRGDSWFGAGAITGGGLSQLSGGSFTTFQSQPGGMLSNKPLFLHRDSTGLLWASMATEPTLAGTLGFSVWDGGAWSNFPAVTLGFPGGNPGFVWELAEDPSGWIWAGTGKGVARRASGNWTVFTPGNSPLAHNRVYRVAVDATGRKWFGTLGGGIDVLDDNGTLALVDDTWTNYDQPILPSGTIRALAFDAAGNAWAGTQRGAAFFDGASWTTFDETNSGLVHDHVTAIHVDSSGDVWFGTYGRGVSRFQPGSGQWDTFSDANGALLGRHILDIDEDSDGKLLFANYQGGGVGVFDPGP